MVSRNTYRPNRRAALKWVVTARVLLASALLGVSFSTATSTLPARAAEDVVSQPAGRTVAALLSEIVVRPESAKVPYRRDLYRHWLDQDDDGCDTRREVLAEEAQTPLEHCWSRSGAWLSVYDGKVVDESGELDIDHVVALAEAHRSGADRWSADRKEAFANDLGSPWSLVAVTASTNRSKSDLDPARWSPANREGKCFLARATVITKWRWRLSVDKQEAAALKRLLRGCRTLVVRVERMPAAS